MSRAQVRQADVLRATTKTYIDRATMGLDEVDLKTQTTYNGNIFDMQGVIGYWLWWDVDLDGAATQGTFRIDFDPLDDSDVSIINHAITSNKNSNSSFNGRIYVSPGRAVSVDNVTAGSGILIPTLATRGRFILEVVTNSDAANTAVGSLEAFLVRT